MTNKTALNKMHRDLGAKMVDFGGWDMPLHYGSQIREHEAVRRDCGMFDVSHMRVVDLSGAGAEPYLRYLLANDVAKISPGRALYSAMLNDRGGIVDDLIVYFLGAGEYRVVLNCATADRDIDWMRGHTGGYDVAIVPRPDLAIIAVQGPNALGRVKALACDDAGAALDAMPVFGCARVGSWTLGRTGYTGEDGVRSFCLPREPKISGSDCWMPAYLPWAWERGTPCGLRRGSTSTAATWTRP